MIFTHLVMFKFFSGASEVTVAPITRRIVGRMGIGGVNRVNVKVPVVNS